jgi:hypothetical protein
MDALPRALREPLAAVAFSVLAIQHILAAVRLMRGRPVVARLVRLVLGKIADLRFSTAVVAAAAALMVDRRLTEAARPHLMVLPVATGPVEPVAVSEGHPEA